MKKKVIGIPCSSVGETGFGATKNYLQFANVFGNVRIIMPWEDVVDEVDMIILPGGADVNPMQYGEAPEYNTGNTDVFKNFFFEHKLDGYIKAGKAIVGICLGHQQLAVYFGCKLTQDLVWHAQSKDRWAGAHEIIEVKNVLVKALKVKVNSHHHQGVTLANLQPCLTPLYLAENEDRDWSTDKSAIVESFKHKTLPVLGFQWHPEELYDEISVKLIRNLLEENELQRQAGSK